MNSCSSEDQLAINIKVLLIEYPEIVQALSISSKQVGSITASWMEDKILLEKRHLYTIYKYISRMATRSTPFGLSAGVGVGVISTDETNLEISTRSKFHSRLSAAFLSSQFKGAVLAQTFTDQELLLNSTLFKSHGFFRYARKSNENSTEHNRIKIKINPLLELVYQQVFTRTSFLDLTKYLIQIGLSEHESTKYIIQLLECDFLISIFNPSLSGNHYRKLLEGLQIKGVLGKLACNINNRVDSDYKELVKHWEDLSLETKIDLLPELEVNRQIGTRNVIINQKIVQRISSELTDLIPYIEKADQPELELFKTKFLKKYDLQEIPLLEALDSDLSLGYGDKTQQYCSTNPLLKSLHFDKADPIPKIELHELIDKELITESRTIELKLPIIPKQYLSPEHLSPTSALHGILYSTGISIDKPNNFSFFLKSWNGPTSNHLLSRFAYMDNELHTKLLESSAFDQKMFEGYILAEIVYSPTGSEANILQRPDLYTYEIPILGNSSKNKNFQIPLQDIVVSIKNNKVLLRSIKHNKYIVPRLTSAHNYRRANPIYRFLADLQYQFSPYHFKWNWKVSAKRSFLPRITYKHLILSRACWYISQDCIRQKNEENLLQLIKQHKIDDIVVIAEGDNELYVDLGTPWGREILLGKIKKGAVKLYEVLEKENYILSDIKGQKYVHEITIPLSMKVTKPAPSIPEKKGSHVVRSFPPGSKWTYLKIYCSPTDADEILLTIVHPIILQLQTQNSLESWFFVRYNDPDYHIRLRFYHPLESFEHFQTITALFSDKFHSEDFRIDRLQYDTYEREVERYGIDTIESIENIFSIDSKFIFKILSSVQSTDENLRWKVAIIGINSIFNSFSVLLEDRIQFLNIWSNTLKSEFSLSKDQVKQINLDYRKVRSTIDAILTNQDINTFYVHEIVIQMESELNALLKKLVTNQKSSITTRLGSIFHMFMNRLFPTDQKANEMVIYIYTYHYYKSVQALNKSLN